MPSKVSWYLEPYVLHSEYIGNVTLNDLQQAMQAGTILTENYIEGIYLLVNFTQAESFPTDFRRLLQIARSNKNPKLGIRLVYGRHRVVNMIANSFGRLVGLQTHFFDTLDEAVGWLHQHDPKISALLYKRSA